MKVRVLMTTYVWILICELVSTTNFGSRRLYFIHLAFNTDHETFATDLSFLVLVNTFWCLASKTFLQIMNMMQCHPIQQLFITIFFPQSLFPVTAWFTSANGHCAVFSVWLNCLIGSTAAGVETLQFTPNQWSLLPGHLH